MLVVAQIWSHNNTITLLNKQFFLLLNKQSVFVVVATKNVLWGFLVTHQTNELSATEGGEHTNTDTGHTCRTPRHCALSCVFSDHMLEWMNNCTGHTCWAPLHCVSTHVFLEYLSVSLNNYTGHTCRASLHYVFLYEFSDGLLVKLNNYTGHTCRASLRCVSSYVLSDHLRGRLIMIRITLEGLLSTVCSYMTSQMACL